VRGPRDKEAAQSEALEPLRQGLHEHFGGRGPESGNGLRIRNDRGSHSISDPIQKELHLLGLESSTTFVLRPARNVDIERSSRTLIEQLLWVRQFYDLEELQVVLRDFRERYSGECLIERLSFRSLQQARERLLAVQQTA